MSTLTVTLIRKRQEYRMKWTRFVEEKAAKMFCYFLSLRPVQREIAEHMLDGGYMCAALERAIKDTVANINLEIDADEVRNLDDVIGNGVEEALRNHQFEAEDVKDLDGAIEALIEHHKDDIVEAVMEELVERLRK